MNRGEKRAHAAKIRRELKEHRLKTSYVRAHGIDPESARARQKENERLAREAHAKPFRLPRSFLGGAPIIPEAPPAEGEEPDPERLETEPAAGSGEGGAVKAHYVVDGEIGLSTKIEDLPESVQFRECFCDDPGSHSRDPDGDPTEGHKNETPDA